MEKEKQNKTTPEILEIILLFFQSVIDQRIQLVCLMEGLVNVAVIYARVTVAAVWFPSALQYSTWWKANLDDNCGNVCVHTHTDIYICIHKHFVSLLLLVPNVWKSRWRALLQKFEWERKGRISFCIKWDHAGATHAPYCLWEPPQSCDSLVFFMDVLLASYHVALESVLGQKVLKYPAYVAFWCDV